MFVCGAKLPPNPLGTTPKRFMKARGESCRYPTAASMLAAYGSLDGEAATTHHLYEHALQQRHPAVDFVNGMRFLENDKDFHRCRTYLGHRSRPARGAAILRAPSPRLLSPTWSITAHCRRIRCWPRSRRGQRAGRDLYHRVVRLESPRHLQKRASPLGAGPFLRLAKLAAAGSHSDTRRSQQLRFKGYAVSSAPCPCRGRRWERRARPWRAQLPGSRHSPPVRCCSTGSGSYP